MFFSSYNVNFEKGSYDESIIANGEIRNETLKDYSLVMFKIIVYNKRCSLGSGIIKIYDFKRTTTRAFNVILEVHRGLLPTIVKHEIVVETAY